MNFKRLLLVVIPMAELAAQGAPPAQVLGVMERVADWQLANPPAFAATEWKSGTGYAGIMALAGISGSPRFHDAMLKMAEAADWNFYPIGTNPFPYDADVQAVGQTYLELYFRHREPRMLAHVQEQLDRVLANVGPATLRVDRGRNPRHRERWSWCDALFMAPPTWVRAYVATGRREYLDYLVKEWWATSDYLYDPQEHLFFRDGTYLLDKRDAGGRKIFWGRGNGWVMGGLVRVLQYLPDDHPARVRFERQFREMAARIRELQQPDGLWRASLLDPTGYPMKETSGSGFFCYALAWGVNQGLLDRAVFRPAVARAWGALADCVDATGRLTHVQPVGASPRDFAPDSTAIYGVGAFLLAGSEVYRLGVLESAQSSVVTVSNPAAERRILETVELNLAEFAPLSTVRLAVLDGVSAAVLPAQLLNLDSDGKAGKLIFQVDLAPRESRRFRVVPAAALAALPPVAPKTHARFVPERLDDFAWESDRIAHRMYGPAVIAGEGLVSSGVDVWAKRVRRLVVDGWYKQKGYHKDYGEGLDYYKVGPDRGCGGLGIWEVGAQTLHVSSNFIGSRVLADGPLRSVFELDYAPWHTGGRVVSETKRISIDAGSNFSRCECRFESATPGVMTVGIGISDRGGNSGVWQRPGGGSWFAYWEPEVGQKGRIGCAVVVPAGIAEFVHNGGNVLGLAAGVIGQPFVYYLGAGWSKSGDFPDEKSWFDCTRAFAARVAAPLIVRVDKTPRPE